MDTDRKIYSCNYLLEFTRQVFIKMGCPVRDADNIADIFLAAELRGHASHGLLRIRDYYELWKAGRINAEPAIKVVHETASTGSRFCYNACSQR